ncbi:MAG: zinc-ribbon domain-containing protein [Clostridiales bacterium]|nr:zinc-ribbon domain-containing protein [Clostridiales bacterium]
MYCSNCGNEMPEGSKFCSKCGCPMESVAQPGKEPQSRLKGDLSGNRRAADVPAPRERKGRGGLLLIAGLALLLAICGIGAALLWNGSEADDAGESGHSTVTDGAAENAEEADSAETEEAATGETEEQETVGSEPEGASAGSDETADSEDGYETVYVLSAIEVNSEDGSSYTEVAITYDDDGNGVMYTAYDSNGDITGYVTCEYDDDGNLVSAAVYIPDYLGYCTYECTYDENGYPQEDAFQTEDGGGLTISVVHNTDGSYTATWTQFDSDGNQINGIGETTYDSGWRILKYIYYYGDRADPSILDEDIYDYDDSGNLVTKTVYKDGELSSETKYTYDSNGNMLTDTTDLFSSGTSYLTRTYVYEYDSAGNRIKETYYTGDETIEQWKEYTYDDSGRLQTRTDYENYTGGYTESHTYQYVYADTSDGYAVTATKTVDGIFLSEYTYQYTEIRRAARDESRVHPTETASTFFLDAFSDIDLLS